MKLLIKLLIAGGTLSAPAFTVSMTALSNASGSVTTQAFITGGGGAYADLVIAIAAAKAGSTFTAQGTSITVSAVPNRTSGKAPMGVFVDCSGTTAAGITSKPFHDLYYVTYFDDDNTATFSYGTQPGVAKKNVAIGPEAAHVFETAKTCNVKTTAFHLSSDGLMLSIGATVVNAVTISDYTMADTIYVSSTTTPSVGVDEVLAGAGGYINTTSFATIVGYLTTGKRVLAKRGDTWTTGTSNYTPVASGTMLGCYGLGVNPPKVTATSANIYMILPDTGTTDMRWVDWEIDGASLGSGGTVTRSIAGSIGTNTFATFLRIYSHHAGKHGDPEDDSIVADCRYTNTIGGGGPCGVYSAKKQRIALIGTLVDDATAAEHCIRLQGVKKVVVSNCTAKNPATLGDKQVFTLRGWANGVTWEGDYTEQVVVSDNAFSWTGSVSNPIEIAAQSTGHDERHRNIIYERNWHDGPGVGTLLRTEAESGMTIRNNLFDCTGYTGSAIEVYNSTLVSTPPPTDTSIYNNSFYKSDSGSLNILAMRSYSGTPPTGTRNYNNLAYAPSGSGAIISADAGCTKTDATNTSPAQLTGTAPGFTIPPTTTLTTWKPTSGYAINGGTWVPVFDDFFGAVRTGTTDIGAVNP